MTDEQINAAVSEALRGGAAAMANGRGGGSQAPDYCNDLNACHEMEKTLTDQQYHSGYKQTLSSLVGSEGDIRVPSAGARLRAEAFLRTIGKWKASA